MNGININRSLIAEPKSLKLPSSWVGHIPFAFWLVDNLNPKVFVELGSHNGDSYFSFCQAIKANGSCCCYAIDTWEGDEHAGLYTESVFDYVSKHNQENYESFSTLKRMYFSDALKDFENNSIDLLHIDGLHTYEAVKEDFETWLPKMSDQGVIIFHDVCVDDHGFGVWKLWDEIKNRYPHLLFKHSHGLGVLGVGKELPKLMQDLFSGEQLVVEEVFSALGMRLEDKFVDFRQIISDFDSELKKRNKEISMLQEEMKELRSNLNVTRLQLDEEKASVKTFQSRKVIKIIDSIYKLKGFIFCARK
ncbi:MAG: class I SAM-dependent methyltransferase [Pseudomonadales bacterium]|nr:class I SAM-dependent methyltransferase [Pseudomonadales bacterium]